MDRREEAVQQSTQASALSAASLARRKAAQAHTTARRAGAVTVKDTAVVEERDRQLDNVHGEGFANLATGGDASAAFEPGVDLELHSPSSAHTSSIGRLIAEIASPESDKQESRHDMTQPEEALAMSSFDEVLDFAPSVASVPLEPAHPGEDEALLTAPAPAFRGGVSPVYQAAFATDDLVLDDLAGELAEPRDFRDASPTHEAPCGLELFDVPSSLPSVTDPVAFVDHPDLRRGSDEAAFREAMLRQWPKTTL